MNINYLKGYKVKKDIHYKRTDFVILEIKELEIYGEGTTYEEAFNDLTDELLDLINNLWDTPDHKLGKDVLRWKIYLHDHLEKK